MESEKNLIRKLLDEEKRPIHIIAAGGVGMSALASILLRLGFTVSASDLRESVYLGKLRSLGAKTWSGHSPESIAENAVVFYGSAVPEGDPERSHAREKNLFQFSRHGLLAYISSRFFTIAVAGTHGKTTTSAWIAWTLQQSGYEPIALIGGTLSDWNSNVYLPDTFREDTILVIEADESDSSFLHIEADIAAITNVELDHTDHFSSLDSLTHEFFEFARGTIARGGKAILSRESCDLFPELLSEEDRCCRKITTQQSAIAAFDRKYEVRLAGEHNLWNASVVYCTLQAIHVKEDEIADGLSHFHGVKRRMEIIVQSEKDGKHITIIDDYAHHPKEISVVLDTLSRRYDSIIAVWEPHRASRLNHFYRDFEEILFSSPGSHLKKTFLVPLFLSGDKLENFHDAEQYLQKHSDSFLFTGSEEENYEQLLLTLENSTTEAIAVVFMGAGHSDKYARSFAEIIERGK